MSSTKQHPMLAAYLKALNAHPLRTKMITSGVLSFAQELIASHLAGESTTISGKNSSSSKTSAGVAVDAKSVKMALYGAMVSAPMGHFLVGILQRAFAGRTSKGSRFAQVLASNLFVAPIQTGVYLCSIAVINGLRSPDAILRTVKARFLPVLKITWITSPVAIIIAQNLIPPELWVPWFNLVAFLMGTYLNTKVKKLALSAAKKKRGDDSVDGDRGVRS